MRATAEVLGAAGPLMNRHIGGGSPDPQDQFEETS